jgi:predicted negative regulator of RcsB-dependent stress response
MSDIIQEVAEDIKTEKFFYVIKKFTKIFVVLSLIALLATAGFVYHNYKYEQKQLAFSIDYHNLANANIDSPDYSNLLNKLTKSDSEAYGAMANISYAKQLIAVKNYQEAFKILTSLYNNSSNNVVFRNISRVIILATILAQDLKDISLDNKISETTSNQPFNNLIKLLYAQILLGNDKIEEAKAILTELLDKNNLSADNIYFLAHVLMNNISNK